MSKFDWKVLDRNYEDVIYETYNGIAKITINRPEVRKDVYKRQISSLRLFTTKAVKLRWLTMET